MRLPRRYACRFGLRESRVESPTNSDEPGVVCGHGDRSNLPEVFTPFALQQGLVVPDAAEGKVSEEAAGQPDPQNEEKDRSSTDVPESGHSDVSRTAGMGGYTTTYATLSHLLRYVLIRGPA